MPLARHTAKTSTTMVEGIAKVRDNVWLVSELQWLIEMGMELRQSKKSRRTQMPQSPFHGKRLIKPGTLTCTSALRPCVILIQEGG